MVGLDPDMKEFSSLHHASKEKGEVNSRRYSDRNGLPESSYVHYVSENEGEVWLRILRLTPPSWTTERHTFR